MKFLAILKDSVREAVDSKVFFVMLGLSTLMIFLAASLSFKPQPAKDLFDVLAFPLNSDWTDMTPEKWQKLGKMQDQGKLHVYQVRGVEPLNGAKDAPGSDFSVIVGVRFAKEEEADKVKRSPEGTVDLLKSRFGAFDELRVVEVTKVQLASSDNRNLPEKPDPKEVYFELETHPTSVTLRLWPHEPSIFFGAFSLSGLKTVPLGLQLYIIEDLIVNWLGAWVAILLSIVITSFFIPNMLRKGTIDLLLAKPIHRVTLLSFKYLGGLIFIFLNTAFVVSGMWLAVGLRSGIWATGFLFTILVITFFFAVLYAVSTLFAVLTRSTIVAILMTCFVWGFLTAMGYTYKFVEDYNHTKKTELAAEGAQYSENWFGTGVRFVHFILPRTRDLDFLTTRLLVRDLLTANQIREQKIDTTAISWGESITVNCVFIGLLLGFSSWWFATRDY